MFIYYVIVAACTVLQLMMVIAGLVSAFLALDSYVGQFNEAFRPGYIHPTNKFWSLVVPLLGVQAISIALGFHRLIWLWSEPRLSQIAGLAFVLFIALSFSGSYLVIVQAVRVDRWVLRNVHLGSAWVHLIRPLEWKWETANNGETLSDTAEDDRTGFSLGDVQRGADQGRPDFQIYSDESSGRESPTNVAHDTDATGSDPDSDRCLILTPTSSSSSYCTAARFKEKDDLGPNNWNLDQDSNGDATSSFNGIWKHKSVSASPTRRATTSRATGENTFGAAKAPTVAAVKEQQILFSLGVGSKSTPQQAAKTRTIPWPKPRPPIPVVGETVAEGEFARGGRQRQDRMRDYDATCKSYRYVKAG